MYFLTAEQCAADEITLSCYDSNSLAAGTTNAVKLYRFFDRVIEQKYYSNSKDIGKWKYSLS